MPSPTQRSLAYLRSLGYVVQVVERWNQYARRRIDLFGVIDLLAMKRGLPLLGVQACAGASHAARRTKILAEPNADLWITCGNDLWVLSWSKRGPRGKRKVWTPWAEPITSEMF